MMHAFPCPRLVIAWSTRNKNVVISLHDFACFNNFACDLYPLTIFHCWADMADLDVEESSETEAEKGVYLLCAMLYRITQNPNVGNVSLYNPGCNNLLAVFTIIVYTLICNEKNIG